LYCSEESDIIRIVPDDVEAPVVDTVGAGDSFSAALLGGFLKGSTPEETAQCATTLATRICGQRGATVADMELYKGMEAVTNG
jgi:fructokinase